MAEKKTILIIDDSNTNIVLLEAILKSKGYLINTATSIKEAITLTRNKKPDLILLDLLMPEISGFDFLKSVRAENHLNEVPVVVVSALTENSNIQKTREMGAIEFIKKPIDISSFVETIDRVI